ncbi:MAG: hypothetical protein IKD54_02930 [Clostridia bacterium]|jgi:hypothetical protein|nr:hypothetical protein [Clostridia bacterium]MBR3129727.1 hypothetical protein [Clostridia bacterium]
MKKILAFTMCLMTAFSFFGCRGRTNTGTNGKTYKIPRDGVCVVGRDIEQEDITEFYFTISTSTCPAFYQRYRFYTENGKYYMFHETRKGEEWPLTEKYTTKIGTVKLTDAQWNEFYEFLKDGRVTARSEHLEDGASGPWMYLYWPGDCGDYQEFSFAQSGMKLSFEDFCESLCE